MKSFRSSFLFSLVVEGLVIEQPAIISGTTIRRRYQINEGNPFPLTSQTRRGTLKRISSSTLCDLFSKLSFDTASDSWPRGASRTRFNGVILFARGNAKDSCSVAVLALVADLLGAEGLIVVEGSSPTRESMMNAEPNIVADIPIESISVGDFLFLDHLVNDLQVAVVARIGESVDTVHFF